MFLKWKDIDSFKLASTQSKTLLGVSYKGEYVTSSQFISHDIGLRPIYPPDIDFITLKIDNKATDLKLAEIFHIEVNLDTQQVVFTRGIGGNESHISRFNKLKLVKGDQKAVIHKIIPFNRGSSNFEQVQTFYGTRYTEFERARQILDARGELGLLSTRNIATGDLISHLVLSSMNMLGILPFDTNCLGFSPEDINNQDKISELFTSWFEELQEIFRNIVDVSKSPDFTEHNFTRLTKNIRSFVDLKKADDIEPETFDKLIEELEELTRYMDDFFKLSIYKNIDENLECETIPESGRREQFE